MVFQDPFGSLDPRMTESATFFSYLTFLLQFAPTHPSEVELREQFALIGVEAGKPFDERTLSVEVRTALENGIGDGWREYAAFKKTRIDTREVTSGDNRASFRNLVLQGGVLRGNGAMDIGQNSALTGRLLLEIRSQVAQDRGAFNVSGTVSRPIIKRGG